MYALMVVKVFQKLFTTIVDFLFASLKLLTNFENAYWNPPQNFLLCDRSMFSHWLQGNAQELTCYWELPDDKTESKAASCMHFQLSKSPLWVFETGYWKNFQN
jgi:hypothetical protein